LGYLIKGTQFERTEQCPVSLSVQVSKCWLYEVVFF